jgi:hypothetical protein
LSKWLRKKFPGNMRNEMVLIHNHLNTPTVKSAKLMMEKAGLEVIYTTPYCSGLSGGRIGGILKIIGNALWPLSIKRVALAPSIFLVARG